MAKRGGEAACGEDALAIPGIRVLPRLLMAGALRRPGVSNERVMGRAGKGSKDPPHWLTSVPEAP